MAKARNYIPQQPQPTESIEQICIFRWADFMESQRPELALLHHIPNGGHRSATTAARLKAEGVKPGVPDMCLPVARGGYHGLYIELKRMTGGRISVDQSHWLHELAQQGYCAVTCKGSDDAIKLIQDYLDNKLRKDDNI